jgi:ABC-type bacteriocin/lantibiotic exporter with double-glycine peptidase domain
MITQTFSKSIFLWISYCVKIIISIGLLYQIIGYYCVYTIIFIVLLIILNFFVSFFTNSLIKQKNEILNTKSNVISEIFESLNLVRTSNLEDYFISKMNQLKWNEIQLSFTSEIIDSFQSNLWTFLPIFSLFMIRNVDILDVIFSSFSILNSISFPLLRIPLLTKKFF